ncbi:HPr family phosphocarrier protein [Caproiciproducens sp.]|uniref:HPr family phosphocarrier protein n=1 Tax=Caproiciproducens sp. TaxID=1954376 RepID=UPI00289A32FD|nr:HPr family phosphocarrier protein [Caproiciproducens sp.]
MTQFQYIVQDPEGLHARPAGKLAKFAQECSSEIIISLNGKTANTKRLFAILGLGVKQGDKITVQVQGDKELSDCKRLEEFCKDFI